MLFRSFELTVGESLELDAFRARLIESGYASVSQVTGPGEFAQRGSLLDVFPMGSTSPLRIDLFDEEIEAIRRFDPDTQRSLDALERVRLLPAREMPLDADAVRAFRRRFRDRFEGDPMQTGIYRGVSEGLAPPGIEFYLPLFHDSTASLFDYLPPDAVIAHDASIDTRLASAYADIEQRYEDRRHDLERPVLAPQELFLAPADGVAHLDTRSRIVIEAFKAEDADGTIVHNFPTSAPRELRAYMEIGRASCRERV